MCAANLRARTDNSVIRDGAAGLPAGSNTHGGLSADLRGLEKGRGGLFTCMRACGLNTHSGFCVELTRFPVASCFLT